MSVRLPPGFEFGQLFTHISDEGVTRHFGIPRLKDLLAKRRDLWELVTLPIDRELGEWVAQHRGVEEDHVRRLQRKDLDEPGLGVVFQADESLLTVDGNHRLVKRARFGMTEMDFYIIREPHWHQCLLSEAEILDPKGVLAKQKQAAQPVMVPPARYVTRKDER